MNAPATVRPKGAILLGGAHGTLALARQLQREGLAVWLVTDDTPLPGFSRAVTRRIAWPGPKSAEAAAFLEDLAKLGATGFLVIACADADVRFLAENRARLAAHFEVLLPDWDQLRWACDKLLMGQRAAELGLATPRPYAIASLEEAQAADVTYPVVLKPAMRLARNRFTTDKAWRADDRTQFLALFAEAADLVGPENIVVQELVPGGGETQLSYAALWHHGVPVLSFTACRKRQYPLEFSYTSTYVETAPAPDVTAAAEAFLASIGHHGLVEMEFKRDSRDGSLKLLDINPRPWSWLSLADAAGIDLGGAIARGLGETQTPTARNGIGWIFGVRDLVAALQLFAAGQLRPRDYFGSLARCRSAATFSWRDPLPGLLEMPLTLWRVLSRLVSR
jgi:D-aspartate ligase